METVFLNIIVYQLFIQSIPSYYKRRNLVIDKGLTL